MLDRNCFVTLECVDSRTRVAGPLNNLKARNATFTESYPLILLPGPATSERGVTSRFQLFHNPHLMEQYCASFSEIYLQAYQGAVGESFGTIFA